MENLIDRRCMGCKQICDDTLYYVCAQKDYKFYTSEPENDKDILWGEKCKTCKYKFCKIDKAEKCIENDYKYYKGNSVIEKIELVLSKPKYKAFSFTGRPSIVAKELNEFFAENPQVEIVKMVEVEDYAIEESGVVMVVREN